MCYLILFLSDATTCILIPYSRFLLICKRHLRSYRTSHSSADNDSTIAVKHTYVFPRSKCAANDRCFKYHRSPTTLHDGKQTIRRCQFASGLRPTFFHSNPVRLRIDANTRIPVAFILTIAYTTFFTRASIWINFCMHS